MDPVHFSLSFPRRSSFLASKMVSENIPESGSAGLAIEMNADVLPTQLPLAFKELSSD